MESTESTRIEVEQAEREAREVAVREGVGGVAVAQEMIAPGLFDEHWYHHVTDYGQ